MKLTDFHVHPDYSVDASGTIDQYCARALQIGLDTVCFTTHYDTNPLREGLDGYWGHNGSRAKYSDRLMEIYVDDIHRADGSFRHKGLRVLCGLEIDYYPGVEEEARRIKEKFPIDFVLGSVHCIENIAISDEHEARPYFESRSVETMMDDYISLLVSAARCESFDSLGHLDYYVRFAWRYYGHRINDIRVERFDPVFEILAANRLGIEINTGPYKRSMKAFHPTVEILDRAIDAGVSIVSVGSDSHRPEDLGAGIPEAYQYLRKHYLTPEFPRSL